MPVTNASAEDREVSFVLAAEMPDINNLTTSRYAELKHLIELQKKETQNTFFFFGGGSIGPSALSNLDRGSHIIDILNSLEPDAMGVSKRDLSYFEDELSLRSYEAAFPIVASNLLDSRTAESLDGLVKHALVTKGDVSVGFLSVAHERVVQEYLLKHTTIPYPKETIINEAQKLRDLGADIIFLHHYKAFDFVEELLDKNHVDFALISSSQLLPSELEAADKHAKILSFNEPGQAIVVKHILGNTQETTVVKRIPLHSVSIDITIQKQVDANKLRLNRLLDSQIGYWVNPAVTQREAVRTTENAFGNFVADTLKRFTSADIALINGGSIRGDRRYSSNDIITRRTIATELPFRASLKVLSVTGEQLNEALELGLSGVESVKGSFPHVAGMNVVYDSSADTGNRVLSITIGGKKLDMNRRYILATSDYLAGGGDGYTAFTKGQVDNQSILNGTILISDLVLQEVKRRGKLASKVDGRMVNKARGAN